MSHEDYPYFVSRTEYIVTPTSRVSRTEYIADPTSQVYNTLQAIEMMKQGNKMCNKAYDNSYRIINIEGTDVLVDVTTKNEFTYEAELSLDEVVADWVLV
jgi:uncharacterized membrane protein